MIFTKEEIVAATLGGLGAFFCLSAVFAPSATSAPKIIFWLAMAAEAFSLAIAPHVLFARLSWSRPTDNADLCRSGVAAVLDIVAQVAFGLALIAWLLSLT